MTAPARLPRLADRMFDRMRDRRAFEVDYRSATEGDFELLRGTRYALLVTFRRNGEPVPSPVWVGLDRAGNAYVKTAQYAGKVKRIRHDERIAIAPSNARGRPTGAAVRGTARVLPEQEWAHAEEALVAAYGTGRRLVERFLSTPDDATAYIELSPVRGPTRTAHGDDLEEMA